MKALKFKENQPKITREIVKTFGETVFHTGDVSSIMISIEFKDGSALGFRKEDRDNDR